jgi:hypothetical protein
LSRQTTVRALCVALALASAPLGASAAEPECVGGTVATVTGKIKSVLAPETDEHTEWSILIQQSAGGSSCYVEEIMASDPPAACGPGKTVTATGKLIDLQDGLAPTMLGEVEDLRCD